MREYRTIALTEHLTAREVGGSMVLLFVAPDEVGDSYVQAQTIYLQRDVIPVLAEWLKDKGERDGD